MLAAAPGSGRFAALICDWCLELTPGARVWVDTTTLAADYARALNAAILDRDGWPFVSCAPPGLNADFYGHARERHLSEPPPPALALVAGLDAFVRIGAPGDTRELAGVDPALIAASPAPAIRSTSACVRCATA